MVKIRAKPSTGPAAMLSSEKKPTTRTACHQRPRTRSELPRKASRMPLSVEQDLLLDERPADDLPDREGEADDRDRQQQRRPASASSWRGDDAPEALAHAAPGVAEAQPAGSRPAAARRRSRPRRRSPRRSAAPSDSTGRRAPRWTPERPVALSTPRCRRRSGRRAGCVAADDHQRAQRRSAPGPPVAAVELPRGAHDLAEGAAPAQLGRGRPGPSG